MQEPRKTAIIKPSQVPLPETRTPPTKNARRWVPSKLSHDLHKAYNNKYVEHLKHWGFGMLR